MLVRRAAPAVRLGVRRVVHDRDGGVVYALAVTAEVEEASGAIGVVHGELGAVQVPRRIEGLVLDDGLPVAVAVVLPPPVVLFHFPPVVVVIVVDVAASTVPPRRPPLLRPPPLPLHRFLPVGLLERVPHIQEFPPRRSVPDAARALLDRVGVVIARVEVIPVTELDVTETLEALRFVCRMTGGGGGGAAAAAALLGLLGRRGGARGRRSAADFVHDPPPPPALVPVGAALGVDGCSEIEPLGVELFLLPLLGLGGGHDVVWMCHTIITVSITLTSKPNNDR